MNERLQSILETIKKKKLYIIGGSLIFLVVLLVAFFSTKARPGRLTESTNHPTPKPSDRETSIARKAPVVTIEGYELKSSMPQVPSLAHSYEFKTNFSSSEVQQLAGRFGFTQPVDAPGTQTRTYVNMSDPNKMGALAFNTVNGSYSMRFFAGLPVDGTTVLERAQNFVNQTGLSDTTIVCTDSYTREGFEQYTFVACHRDWSKMGLPIYNTVGILNINERTPLSSLKLGQSEIDAPNDSTIIGKTNSTSGKVPPIDFNTVTVAVTNDGKIAMAQSNIRPLKSSSPIPPSSLLTPQEAYDRFIAKQTEFTLTIPAGVGNNNGSSLDWDVIYPNNQAHAKRAVVSDYVYAYLENPSETAQSLMEPKIIMRGTAQLSSGYTVRFVQIVPALKNAQAENLRQGTVAGDSTYLAQDNSLKLGSFTPSVSETHVVTPTPTAASNIPTPTGAQFGTDPSVNPACAIPENATIVNVEIPGVGTMDLAVNAGAGHYRTFYFKSASFSVPDMTVARRAMYETENSPFVQQYLISVAKQRAILPNIAPAGIQSVGDVYSLFSAINEIHDRPDSYSAFQAHCGGSPNFAPPSLACLDELGQSAETSAYYQIPVLRNISQRVAQQYVAASTSNQATALAQRENIFPQEMINNFHWTFIIDEVTGGAGERNRRAGFCYIGGISPVIYVYGAKSSTRIRPSYVTYADPPTQNEEWTLLPSDTNSIKTNDGFERSRLYYEYDKEAITFHEPQNGFILQRGEVDTIVKDHIAKPLGLTSAEAYDLLVDTKSVIDSLPESSYLKISLANAEEIKNILPMNINPIPDNLHRIHLLVRPVSSKQSIPVPVLSPINRTGFTVVELGAAEPLNHE